MQHNYLRNTLAEFFATVIHTGAHLACNRIFQNRKIPRQSQFTVFPKAIIKDTHNLYSKHVLKENGVKN